MPYQPGQSGNPRGKARGRRDRITEAFLHRIEDDWRQHGEEAIRRAREEDPVAYLKVVASLLPRDVTITADDELISALDKLTNDGLRQLVATLAGIEIGSDREGDEAPIH